MNSWRPSWTIPNSLFTGKFRKKQKLFVKEISFTQCLSIPTNNLNLFYYLNSTNVNLYGIVQYGRHWLQLCMTEALSSNLDQCLRLTLQFHISQPKRQNRNRYGIFQFLFNFLYFSCRHGSTKFEHMKPGVRIKCA